MGKVIEVEVVYLSPTEQAIVPLLINEDTSLGDAIALSGLFEKFPDLDLQHHKTGIFGKIMPLNTILKNGDRVEIYRPLRIDPKQKRQARVC
jgi:Uncharacterized protein conserved in bacteria